MTANESHAEREKESRNNNHHHHGTRSRNTSEEASIDTSNLSKKEKISSKDFSFFFREGIDRTPFFVLFYFVSSRFGGGETGGP
jgi:hypothetical protein